MSCKSARDLMLVALTGSVAPDLRRPLEAHLLVCESCRRETAAIERIIAALRASPGPQLPPGYWPEFMMGLERRLASERSGWRRLVRWARTPAIAWRTAAAASALVMALVIALGGHAPRVENVEDSNAHLRPFVTTAIVQSMPSMMVTLASMKAGLNASEVLYESPPVGGD